MSVRVDRSVAEKGQEPSLGDTRQRLEGALQHSREGPISNDGTSRTVIADVAFEAGELLERADPGITALREWLRGNGSLQDSQEEIDDLRAVIEAATDLLETVDVAALPEAVELSGLPSAIEGKEVPGAVVAGKPTDSVDFGRLTELVDYGKLLQVVDLRALMKEKSDLDDALLNGLITDESDSGTEEQESSTDLSPRDGLQAAYETAHEKSSALDEKVGGSEGGSPSSSTTHSTVPSSRPDIGGATRFSTVPSR